jgi:hypothetical protein
MLKVTSLSKHRNQVSEAALLKNIFFFKCGQNLQLNCAAECNCLMWEELPTGWCLAVQNGSYTATNEGINLSVSGGNFVMHTAQPSLRRTMLCTALFSVK